MKPNFPIGYLFGIVFVLLIIFGIGYVEWKLYFIRHPDAPTWTFFVR